MEPIVGIDLGTTNSEVAFIIDGNAEILTDNDNGIIPSCVSLDDQGEILVGVEAKNRAVIAPERTVTSVKRLMGTDRKLAMGKDEYRPQEISALILKSLKSRAEKILDHSIGKAVITVPAYFTDAQRQATREAGRIAGLEVVRIINEPTAAALAYESTRSEAQRILIYDLGGGTFDVSIVRIENGVVEVLASTGDNKLGGDDFDAKIVGRLVAHCRDELSFKIDPEKDKGVMARLTRAAEKAKVDLSVKPYAQIEEDHIGKKGWQDIHLSTELSRLDFEEMIEDELNRTMDSVNRALKDAQLLPSAIDKIILVGGSTRIPKISKMLEEKFGHLPHSEIDPDLCVALGAAIQAGREMGVDSTGVLLDITPYTFGTSAVGEINGEPSMTMFVPLIRRNTKLPAARTEAFYTMYDNQEVVEIRVYQGEKPDALDNIQIGRYRFTLSKAPEGSVILLHFDLDLNGILRIEAVEKATGKKINAVIENAFTGFSDEEIDASRRRIADMWGEEADAEVIDVTEASRKAAGDRVSEEVAQTLTRAESMLNDISAEDRDEVVNLMEDLRDALDQGEPQSVEEYRKTLEEILFYYE